MSIPFYPRKSITVWIFVIPIDHQYVDFQEDSGCFLWRSKTDRLRRWKARLSYLLFENKTIKNNGSMNNERFIYDNKLPKLFAIANHHLGSCRDVIGRHSRLSAFPVSRFQREYLPHLAFGRLRPSIPTLWSCLCAAVFLQRYIYSLTEIAQNRNVSNIDLRFLGWRLSFWRRFTLLSGITTGKEYAGWNGR